ncbi:7702_t:CDS:2 [Acaulospora morrowiae]|uniref:7702_t:CDS:1 n=1 Tax=Acaulospora morrowiae TaxID=94023 RepID=A0A9N8V8T4_9GLOM|nr:7702_t:CDS:2 [Acaulospora morrowiae]
MSGNKASKVKGDAKYYVGMAKEKVGEAIGNEKLSEQGKADKLAGTSEREAASVRDDEKSKHDDTTKKQVDKIINKADDIMNASIENTQKERADKNDADNTNHKSKL